MLSEQLLAIQFQSRVLWDGSFESLALTSPDQLEILIRILRRGCSWTCWTTRTLHFTDLHKSSQIFTDLHVTVVTCYFGRETSGLSKKSWMLGPSSTKHRQVWYVSGFRRMPDLVWNLTKFEISWGYRIQIRMPTLKRTRPHKAHCGSRMGIVACIVSSSFRRSSRSFARSVPGFPDTGILRPETQNITTDKHSPTTNSPFCVSSWGWTPAMTAHPLPGYGPLNLEAGNEVAGGKGCAGRWMMCVSHSLIAIKNYRPLESTW